MAETQNEAGTERGGLPAGQLAEHASRSSNPEAIPGDGEMATVLQTTLPVVDDKGKPVTTLHRARSGQHYELSSRFPCEMPMEDAFTFLTDPAFEVRDANGEIVTPTSTTEVEAGRVELAEDEVIAKFEELAAASLLKRCKKYVGSESFKPNTKKDTMIDFLITENARRKAQFGVARGSEQVIGEMDRAGLDKLVDLKDKL